MTSGATSARAADPCCFVIFGASGDLTHRLLIPALYNLPAGGLLPEGFSLIAVSRPKLSGDVFQNAWAKSLRGFATRPLADAPAQRLLACVTLALADPRARQRSGISSCSGSPTDCASRFGTGTTSITSRSRWPRR